MNTAMKRQKAEGDIEHSNLQEGTVSSTINYQSMVDDDDDIDNGIDNGIDNDGIDNDDGAGHRRRRLRRETNSQKAGAVATTGAGAAAETHMRSVLKGITWRVIATSTTMIIAWFITGQVQLALEIGVVEVFAKLAIYYVHERVWARIRV